MNEFPPIFIVSLKEAEARRAGMSAQMEKLGLLFKFFDAFDGRQTNVLAQDRYNGARRLAFWGRHLDGGEWGCLMSHMNIYRHMLENNLPHAIILEDDALLDPNFKTVIENMLKIKTGCELIRFFGSPKVAGKKQRRIAELSAGIWLSRLPSIHGGSHAYYITQDGARKMLHHFETKGASYPIDFYLGHNWETGISALSVNPVAKQDLSYISAIGDEREDPKQDVKGLHCLTFPLTRGWYKISTLLRKQWIYRAAYMKDKKLSHDAA